jgi:5-formyltetrahydrofolate cyclo-ligase
MEPMEADADKRLLRQKILAERAGLSHELRAEYSRQAMRQLLQFEPLTRCRTVMAFYPFREEIDTRRFLEAAVERGQEVWLPLTLPEERRIIPYRYTGPQVLRKGAYGIMEPDPALAEQVDLSRLQAVLVPGVAFDRSGGRMGYGAGYYDRFLAQITQPLLLIGCGFSCQIAERVPMEPHDFRMQYIATEGGLVEANPVG